MFVWCSLFFLLTDILFLHCSQEEGEGSPRDEKPMKVNYEASNYDKDLVAMIERDMVQRNPNVRWYECVFVRGWVVMLCGQRWGSVCVVLVMTENLERNHSCKSYGQDSIKSSPMTN